jgi:hypothetical protein
VSARKGVSENYSSGQDAGNNQKAGNGKDRQSFWGLHVAFLLEKYARKTSYDLQHPCIAFRDSTNQSSYPSRNLSTHLDHYTYILGPYQPKINRAKAFTYDQ